MRPAGCRAVLLFGAPVLQAVPRRPPGISRRKCRRFLRHQRNRPAVGSCAAPTTRITHSCWSTRCSSCLPADQARLRDCMTRTSLLDELLGACRRAQPCRLVSAERPRISRGVRSLRAIGGTTPQWSGQAIHRGARGQVSARKALEGITASGPPLPVLLRSLEMLRDLRLAADRRDITTRHDDLDRLRSVVHP